MEKYENKNISCKLLRFQLLAAHLMREPLLTPDLPLFSDQAGDFMLFKNRPPDIVEDPMFMFDFEPFVFDTYVSPTAVICLPIARLKS